MNALFLMIGLWFFWAPVQTVSTENNISAEETASRMCRCGQENQLPTLAKAYNAATTEEEKHRKKGEIGQAIRKMHVCMNMAEVQQSVRNLPKEQRLQFEKNVQKILNETCGEVSVAINMFR